MQSLTSGSCGSDIAHHPSRSFFRELYNRYKYEFAVKSIFSLPPVYLSIVLSCVQKHPVSLRLDSTNTRRTTFLHIWWPVNVSARMSEAVLAALSRMWFSFLLRRSSLHMLHLHVYFAWLHMFNTSPWPQDAGNLSGNWATCKWGPSQW